MMSLLKYFKKKTKEGLPDPKGPLSTSIPSDAISLANQQVSIATSGKKHGPYNRYRGTGLRLQRVKP